VCENVGDGWIDLAQLHEGDNHLLFISLKMLSLRAPGTERRGRAALCFPPLLYLPTICHLAEMLCVNKYLLNEVSK
jgi:hypothetical protein